MGGGLMQLVAYGAQDIYLTGNPQITFFKVVYRRHTNFSMEYIQQNFEGPNELAIDTAIKLSCKINRNGDLLSNIYFVFNIPDIYSPYDPITNTSYKFRWIKNIGTNIINNVQLVIGGNIIDKH